MNLTMQKYNNFGNFDRDRKIPTMKRCNSTGKALLQQYQQNKQNETSNVNTNYIPTRSRLNTGHNRSRDKDNSISPNNQSKLSNVSMVSHYLDRRHNETQEKINKMRMEKFEKEVASHNFRPQISKNSRKIIDKIVREEELMKVRGEENMKMDYSGNRSHSNSNSKSNANYINKNTPKRDSNITKKLTKTIDELSEYKKMMEKRETIIREEEEKRNRLRREAEYNQRKRPSSTNPKQRTNNNLMSRNENTTTPTHNKTASIQNTLDNSKDYMPYDSGKVIEARNRLNNYYVEKERNTHNMSNMHNMYNMHNNFYISSQQQPKKLFAIENNLYPSNQPIKIKEISSPVSQLPPEKNFNLNVDFNQFDQFSPPNNNLNSDNNSITYNIQQAYRTGAGTGIGSGKEDGPPGTHSNNYTSHVTATFNKNNSENNTGRSHSHRAHMNPPNRRREDLEVLRNFAENIKMNNYYTGNYNTIGQHGNEMNRIGKNQSQNINQTPNMINSEQYKLNSDSKSFALERMKEMKAKAAFGGKISVI